MLVFLVFCAYLRTLQGAPLLPLHATSSMAVVDLMGRDSVLDSACGDSQSRTVYSIVQSCLLTIFACVWTSLHPNINGPRDSDWTCLKRKVTTMLCAVIAPELVLYWALRQRYAAKEIAKKYNETFANSGAGEVGQTEKSLWGQVMDRFLPPSEETIRRGDGQLWTTTHGFFIQMGGFMLYDNGLPKQVLDYKHLADLLQKKSIDAPIVTERDLQDRSKGDPISKAIVLLQTTWFVFQCFARWGQHLPLSELEVLTLAFAVMNVTIYVAWWNKPQGVDMATCVPLKKAEKVIANFTSPPTVESLSDKSDLGPANPLPKSNDDVPLFPLYEQEPDVSPGNEDGWLKRTLRKDCKQHSFPVFFMLRLPYRIVLSVLRTLDKIGEDVGFERADLRVPMFYASDQDNLRSAVVLAACGVGTIFGAIHLLAWASPFPSPSNLVLWRVSAIVLTVTPSLIYLMVTTNVVVGGIGGIGEFLSVFFFLLIPFYIIGRFAMIIIALLAIHDPPRDVLRDISWTLYIPHF